jgi:hypothetical protein
VKLWVIVLTGLVLLLLADVAVLQARLQSFGLGELKVEVEAMRDSLTRLQNWEAVVAEQPVPTQSLTPTSVPQIRQSKLTKEVYIPLGSGTTKNQEWVDGGGQAYIDTGAYVIKEVYFEASLRSNSGEAGARLVNKNENEIVSGSEIYGSSSVPTLVRSGKLNLPAGNKLYGIQLRSQTQQDVFMENAKVRLLVQE